MLNFPITLFSRSEYDESRLESSFAATVFLFKAQHLIKLSTSNGPDGLDIETEVFQWSHPCFWSSVMFGYFPFAEQIAGPHVSPH